MTNLMLIYLVFVFSIRLICLVSAKTSSAIRHHLYSTVSIFECAGQTIFIHEEMLDRKAGSRTRTTGLFARALCAYGRTSRSFWRPARLGQSSTTLFFFAHPSTREQHSHPQTKGGGEGGITSSMAEREAGAAR